MWPKTFRTQILRRVWKNHRHWSNYPESGCFRWFSAKVAENCRNRRYRRIPESCQIFDFESTFASKLCTKLKKFRSRRVKHEVFTSKTRFRGFSLRTRIPGRRAKIKKYAHPFLRSSTQPQILACLTISGMAPPKKCFQINSRVLAVGTSKKKPGRTNLTAYFALE